VQVLSYDESGFHGYTVDMSGIKVYFSAEHRARAFRVTSSARDHVTMLPVIGIDLKTNKCVWLPPLFVTPTKFVNTNPAASQLDPANQRDVIHGSIEVLRGDPLRFKAPPGVPDLTPFPRAHAASASGNVNGVIIQNWMKEHLVPILRERGYMKETHKILLMGDQHDSHMGEGLNEYLQSEMIWHRYVPPHGTNYTQALDADDGPLAQLKTFSEKSIAAWSVYLTSRGTTLSMKDFPFVVQHAFKKAMEDEYIRRAFRVCGLEPRNPDIVLKKFKTGESFEELAKLFKPTPVLQPPSPSGSPMAAANHPSPGQFSDTLSDPSSNRSPRRKAGRRRQHPKAITINPRADAFNFDPVSLEDQAAAVLHKAFLADHVIVGGRGKRLGKEGDIFDAEDIAKRAKDKRVTKQKKLDRQLQKKERKRAVVRELGEQKQALEDEVKQHKKEEQDARKEKVAARQDLHKVELQLAKSKAKRDGKPTAGILTRTQERLLQTARGNSIGNVTDQCILCGVHYTLLAGSGIEWQWDCEGCDLQFCGACCTKKQWQHHEERCTQSAASQGDEEDEDVEEGDQLNGDDDEEEEEEEEERTMKGPLRRRRRRRPWNWHRPHHCWALGSLSVMTSMMVVMALSLS
jgi:hypothetical protein